MLDRIHQQVADHARELTRVTDHHEITAGRRLQRDVTRAGKRAEPLLERLLTLCEGHTEPGMKAGYIWATDKVNRKACRDHLRALYPVAA